MATQSPASTPCPDLEGLRQLVLGELAVPALDQMAQHLEQCSHCVQTVHGLQIGDTLTDALRKSAAVEVSDEPIVSSLIAKLSGLRPAPATPIPGSGATAVAAVPQATHDLHGLLAPARGPDELGRLGPYRILGVLGGGGMGLVLQAEDPQLKRQVALKVMKPQLAINPAARQRFLREAQAAAAVTHDHIVTIYQVGEERGMPFIAMPLLAGESLDDRLKREGRLPVPEVLRIGREIAAGLTAAHERGLIHRDIKPGNIWLEAAPIPGRVKILDFGLVRPSDAADAKLTHPGAFVGTPAFMAPEQARGGDVDSRCDLFSLGCVLYCAATGELPFQGEDTMAVLMALALEEPPAPRQRNSAVPAPLSDLIIRLLAKHPGDRPPSARAVVDAIAALEHGLSPGAAGPEPLLSMSDRQTKPLGRVLPVASRRWLLAGGALVAAAALVLVGSLVVQALGGRQGTAVPAPDQAQVDEKPGAKPAAGDREAPRVYPAAILAFGERGTAVKDYGAKIGDVLFAKLGMAENISLVDREDLKKNLQEQELNLSGMVKAEEATKVGQLTGAKLLITGTITEVDKKLYLVAKIMGTETSRVVSASVEGRQGDEIGALAEKLAEKIAERVTQDADKLVAKPLASGDRVEALNARLKKARRPVVLVKIAERHIGQATYDPAAETEVTFFCRGCGFDVIDPGASTGKAEILITGEGFSEFTVRNGNLITVKARLEVKAVDRQTDKIIAIDRQTAVAVDLSEQLAGKAALQEAAAKLSERLLPKLVK